MENVPKHFAHLDYLRTFAAENTITNPQNIEAMTTKDETIIGQGQISTQGKAKTAYGKGTATWKTVSIGGITGIALGAAGMQAVNAYAASKETSDTAANTTTETTAIPTDAQQATVNQSQSFSDAFNEARAEVGAGGVFLWHGQLYSTYTAEEWQSMSEEQRTDFANNVQPLLGQQTAEPQHVTQQTTHTTEHTTQHTTQHTVETEESQRGNLQQTSSSDETGGDKPEVHFLGVETRDVEGHTMNIGHMTIDNVDVALVDVDNDMVFDVSMADENRNGKVDENEIRDISSRNLSVQDFQVISEIDQQNIPTDGLENANNTHEDLAPDMPDYMNDADTGIV